MCIHAHWEHSKMSMHQYFIAFPQLFAIYIVSMTIWFIYGNWTFCSILSFSLGMGKTMPTMLGFDLFHSYVFASSSSLSLWQTTLCCLPQRVAMNFATKNAQDARGRQRKRERERKRGRQYSWYLVPQILQFASQHEASASKLSNLFFAQRNRNEVSSLWCGLFLACGTCCMPHCGT